MIQKTLAQCDGNVSRAADKPGLSRSALYRRLQKYGL
ncbi:MAG TPA: helix-turn-helix domain-containing protein [Blastocatellia bacterium]|nr:helix-turn-helix domain-containing protein [Blastocatellia bacterium]